MSAGAAGRPEKVVYHISDASNAMQALGNIRNHLNASPNASIVVVTHGAGIDFLGTVASAADLTNTFLNSGVGQTALASIF